MSKKSAAKLRSKAILWPEEKSEAGARAAKPQPKGKTAAPKGRAKPAHAAPPAKAPAAAPAPIEEKPAEAPVVHRRTAEQLAKQQREISVSEFFTKNRHLLGFDNPRKALLTAVKEAVDNSLDACEEAGILPELRVAIIASEGVEDRFRVIVEDNGPGIVPAQVPRIFAKLLYGSKFHRMRMARGQQGIGISAAGMYGQLTTGKPTRIISRAASRRKAYRCELLLDTKKNEPTVVKEEEVDWERPHGTRVEIELEARYTRGRQSVEEYLQQVAIANPHATITFEPPEGEALRLERSSNALPPEPREIKPHPYGIELGMLIGMLQSTRSSHVSSFLHADFSRVSGPVAMDICKRANVKPTTRPARIERDEAERLYTALQATKLMKPPMDCVVPIGEDLLLKGLKRGVEADFYHTVTRPPAVYRGNPFQVEVGVAYGGQLPAEEACRLIRFANRVPLLYQQSACAVTRAAATTAWRNYGIQQSQGQLPVGPLAIVVHIASVWVPFTSESKEAVAHYPEILKEIKLALQECGRKLGMFVRHRRCEADAERKRQYITKYIPHIGIALQEILGLSDKQKSEVVRKLEDMLEKSRNFNGGGGMPNAERKNLVYLGDNLSILRRLPAQSVHLIYVDPPFNTGARQSRLQLKTVRSETGDRVGFGGRRYRTIRLGSRAFADRFEDYIAFLRPRLVEARRVLAPAGSIYIHLNYREVHYAKVMLDGIFGRDCFLNEIIWAYDYGARTRRRWPAKHDNILFYVKDPEHYTFNADAVDRIPYMAPGLVGEEKARRGKLPTDTWWHTIVSPTGKEKTGYPTQKPLGILRRMVLASSNPGDLVMDFFAGSGTTGVAAHESGRRFILVDDNPQAFEVMRKRLKGMNVRFIA